MVPFESSCPPDCKMRNAYCHTSCGKYAQAKAKHAARVAQVRAVRKAASDACETLASGRAKACRWRHARDKKKYY